MNESLEQGCRPAAAAGETKTYVSPLEVLKQQEAEIPAGVPEVHVLKTDENSPPGEIPIS